MWHLQVSQLLSGYPCGFETNEARKEKQLYLLGLSNSFTNTTLWERLPFKQLSTAHWMLRHRRQHTRTRWKPMEGQGVRAYVEKHPHRSKVLLVTKSFVLIKIYISPWSLQPRSPSRKHLAQSINIYCILYELLDLKGKHKHKCVLASAKA